MYTQQIRRNKSNVYMQMHTLGTSSNLGITKLGSSLVSCMQSLQSKKQQILKTVNISKLPFLLVDFKNQHNKFLQLQKNFFQLDESTPQTQRLKSRIKDFLQKIQIQQIQKKLQSLHSNKVRQTQRIQIMNKVQNNSKYGNKILLQNQQQIRERLLQQQSQQLKTIQKLISDIKNIAVKTSNLIHQQGVNLNIAAETLKSAKSKFGSARKELIEANQFQQDTNRKKLFMCLLIVVIVIVILMVIIASRK